MSKEVVFVDMEGGHPWRIHPYILFRSHKASGEQWFNNESCCYTTHLTKVTVCRDSNSIYGRSTLFPRIPLWRKFFKDLTFLPKSRSLSSVALGARVISILKKNEQKFWAYVSCKRRGSETSPLWSPLKRRLVEDMKYTCSVKEIWMQRPHFSQAFWLWLHEK